MSSGAGKAEKQRDICMQHIAVLPSLKCGLIPDSSLTISGDGTSVHAHSNPNGHILPSPAHTLSQQEYASLPRHCAYIPGLEKPVSGQVVHSGIEAHILYGKTGHMFFQLMESNKERD